MQERLQKVLARMGIGSRREIEGWIQNGRVKVNKEIAELGIKVTEDDRIEVDGRQVKIELSKVLLPRVLCYNKPEGEICTREDPEGRKTVFNALPKLKQGRWVMVGRLDINSQGLLLFTTDGELANRLMHPSYEISREYAVRVFGEVSQETLETLTKGVKLEDGMAHFDNIIDGGGEGANHWYHVSLKEGRNREVRRLWASQDVQVSRLVRSKYGNIVLPKALRRGQYEELSLDAVNQVRASVDLPAYIPEKPQDYQNIARRRHKNVTKSPRKLMHRRR